MSGVTGGLVAYEDGRKAGEEYAPPRKVRVELRFDVEPGDDSGTVLDRVGHMAKWKCRELLGTAPALDTSELPVVKPVGRMETSGERRATVPVDNTTTSAAADPLDMGSTSATEPAKRTRRTKAEMEAAKMAEAQPAPFPAGSDPAEVTGVEAPEAATSAADPSVDITDRGLLTAVTDINAKIKKAPEITKIILKYCPNDGVPPSLKRIPESNRKAFLNELRSWASTQKSAE